MFVEKYMADVRRTGYTPRAWVTYFRRWAATSREQAFERPQTLRSLGITGLLGFLFLLGCAIVLSRTTSLAVALEFFQGTGFMLLVGLLAIASNIRMLVDMDGRPLKRINPANIFTLARLVSIPAVFVFAWAGYDGLAIGTFLVGAFTDVVDGWLARHMNDMTPLGRVFDPIVDILFNACAIVVLSMQGYVPGWVLALVLTRYGLLLFGAAIIYIFRGPVEIKPTVLGKATGVVTTGLLFVLVAGQYWIAEDAWRGTAALLVWALGFVEAITIPQVILIGWYNFKRAGLRAQAQAEVDAEAETRSLPNSVRLSVIERADAGGPRRPGSP
jgi:cardiolipin synthase (CMP-forming)